MTDIYSKFNYIDPNKGTTITPNLPLAKNKKKFNYASAINNSMPYISNLANAVRKPPLPSMPESVSPVSLKRINLENSRNNIRRMNRIADRGAETGGLDANSVAAIKASNYAGSLNASNDVNAQEANINTQINNQQTQINSGIEGANINARNQYRNELTGMRIAQQRESSQNLANLSDKYIATQNERKQGDLELSKFRIASDLFKDTGVMDRYMKQLKASGNDDPTGVKGQFSNGGIMKKFKAQNSYSTGGMLRRFKRIS